MQIAGKQKRHYKSNNSLCKLTTEQQGQELQVNGRKEAVQASRTNGGTVGI